MSRTRSDELSPMICALAVLALSLIVYLLLVLFPVFLDDETLQAARTQPQSAATRQTREDGNAPLPSNALVSNKSRLQAQSLSRSIEPVYPPSDMQAVKTVTADAERALPISETAVERSARSLRQTLGINEQQRAQAAVVVELKLAEGCVSRENEKTILPIWYRFDSPTIRTSSINELRSLVAQFRLCENSEFHMTPTAQTDVENTSGLVQMRFNELKYFFTQSSVPMLALHYPENP